jgi:hypothetical protein
MISPVIHVSLFQPFRSRQGRNTVLSLRFAYNAELVELGMARRPSRRN